MKDNANIEEMYVWLSLIEDITYIIYDKIIRYFENLQNIYFCNNIYEIKRAGIEEKTAYNIIDSNIKEKAKRVYENMKKDDVTIVTFDSNIYCKSLKNIYLPPFVYYIKGKNLLEVDNKKIVVTGTREATEYGKMLCSYFIPELLKNNFLVISTIEKGIDRLCIKEIVNKNKKACVVCFKGFDKIKDKREEKLANEVLSKGGMLISEYPYEKDITKSRYYLANRIITGISEKILAIEAGQRSKVNILIDFALEQGKEIYSVPGNIFNQKSFSTNMYIKEGAKVVCQIDDIL